MKNQVKNVNNQSFTIESERFRQDREDKEAIAKLFKDYAAGKFVSLLDQETLKRHNIMREKEGLPKWEVLSNNGLVEEKAKTVVKKLKM
jgi:hypothetical protein